MGDSSVQANTEEQETNEATKSKMVAQLDGGFAMLVNGVVGGRKLSPMEELQYLRDVVAKQHKTIAELLSKRSSSVSRLHY